MRYVASVSKLDAAAIAAASSIATAVVASGLAFFSNTKRNKIDEQSSLFDAYHQVVKNLQTEITRLQDELTIIRSEMKKCESSNKSLSSEIRKLQDCVSKLSSEAERIESALSFEVVDDAPDELAD